MIEPIISTAHRPTDVIWGNIVPAALPVAPPSSLEFSSSDEGAIYVWGNTRRPRLGSLRQKSSGFHGFLGALSAGYFAPISGQSPNDGITRDHLLLYLSRLIIEAETDAD